MARITGILEPPNFGSVSPESTDADLEPGWSSRRTLVFAIVTAGAFWVGVGLVVARVLLR